MEKTSTSRKEVETEQDHCRKFSDDEETPMLVQIFGDDFNPDWLKDADELSQSCYSTIIDIIHGKPQLETNDEGEDLHQEVGLLNESVSQIHSIDLTQQSDEGTHGSPSQSSGTISCEQEESVDFEEGIRYCLFRLNEIFADGLNTDGGMLVTVCTILRSCISWGISV